MKFFFKDFFSKSDQETVDLVTVFEEILYKKISFFAQ